MTERQRHLRNALLIGLVLFAAGLRIADPYADAALRALVGP